MKLIFQNEKGWTNEYTILDHRTKTDYFFWCSSCKTKLIRVDFNQAVHFQELNLNIDIVKVKELKGIGFLNVMTICENCKTNFLININYIEPNNGRDVFFVENIFEIDKNEE